MKQSRRFDAVTVTLNPAIDRTLVISNFSAGKVNRVENVRENAGGKGVNVAAALADFGFRVAATGFLGDQNIDLFEALFAKNKISDRFVRLSGPTRVGIKITDPVQNETTDINFPGLSPKTSDLKTLFNDIETIATSKPTWFVLGGSLPPKVSATIYRDLITALKKRGHKVLLDSSGEPFRHGVEAIPNIIKPNVHELEELTGKRLKTERTVVQAARQLIARGIELVVVSMGERGACFLSQEETVIARPPSVEVKSTVGAGDAMVAGIIAAQLHTQPLANCARLATAFSLGTITQTEGGSAAAIKTWMQPVQIEEVTLGN